MGKGSARRKENTEQYALNWEKIFKKAQKPVEKTQDKPAETPDSNKTK